MDTSDNAPDRTATLRGLGEPGSVLDALVGLVGTEWRRFRERRDAAALLRFAEAIDTTRTQLAVLHTLLERMADDPDVGPALGAGEPRPGPLRDLEEELVQTLSRAGSLRREARVAEPEPGGGRAAARRARGTEGASGEGERGRGGSPVPAPAGNGIAERGQAVEALLSRIHADWQHYRRSPTPEQVGILADEMRQALELVTGLAETLGAPDTGDAAWITDRGAVPFPPYRDQATGLYSRQGFDAAAAAELKKCRRHERPFTVLLLELAVGDLGSLRAASAQVRRTLRESDLVGRHVDRTLAVGLSETTSGDGRLVGTRLVEALQSVEAWNGGGRLGLAGHPDDGQTLLGLLDAARDRFAAEGGPSSAGSRAPSTGAAQGPSGAAARGPSSSPEGDPSAPGEGAEEAPAP